MKQVVIRFASELFSPRLPALLGGIAIFVGLGAGCSTPPGHDPDAYTPRGVFLVSDQIWHEVVVGVPAAIWQDAVERERHTYPYLIYHEEPDGAVDADAVLLFLDRYRPDKVIALGTLPRVIKEAIGVVMPGTIVELPFSEILDFWRPVQREVVYAQGDYEIALLASTYASLTGNPLLIDAMHGMPPDLLDGMDVLLVGDVLCPTSVASCTQIARDAAEMREVLAAEGLGEKLILVRPGDLTIHDSGFYFPDHGEMPIREFSGKMSLAAAPLAAAKDELILSVSGGDPAALDAEMEAEIYRLGLLPEYLTIAASPAAIPMGVEVSGSYQYELDYQVYGSLSRTDVPEGLGLYGNDMFPDLYTGRIFGVTVSDASAYVANVLFYETMAPAYRPKAVIDDDGGADHIHVADRFAEVYSASAINYAYNQEVPLEALDYENVMPVYYAGHGWEGGAGFLTTERLRYEIDDLFPACAYISACLTAHYYPDVASTLFAAQFIRNGGLAFVGAVGYGNDENKLHFLTNLMAGRMDLGRAFTTMRREIPDRWYFHFMSPYVLIGDPTFRPTWMPELGSGLVPGQRITETWIDDLTMHVGVEFDRAVDLTVVESYQPPIMPSVHNSARLWGIPAIHNEIEAVPDDLLPASVILSYRLGAGISMDAELGPCVEREVTTEFFPYRYIQCPPSSIRVCVKGDCQEAGGGSVSGVTFRGDGMLIDYGPGVRTYNLMTTRFDVEAGSKVAEILELDPAQDVRIDLEVAFEQR